MLSTPDERTQNQIDHMMIRKEWRRFVEDTRVYRGADAASDHYLLIMKIKLKLHRNPDRARTNARLDTQRADPCGKFVVNLDVVLFCPWPCVVKIGLAVGSVELSISI